MSKNMFKALLTVFIVGSAWTVQAATTVAIIDSGVDFKHQALSAKMWANPNNQTVDDAGTTYKDDKHGWNFAEKNNQIIDYKYLGKFSQDCYRVVEIQAKILRGTATEAEKAWYKSKRDDEAFQAEMHKFGNFIHGTHVSGISTNESSAANLVALKLIPTEVPGTGLVNTGEKSDNLLLDLFLRYAAYQQGSQMVTVGKYTKAVGARIANGSFGTSAAAVKPIVSKLMEQFNGVKPTDEAAAKVSVEFVRLILDSMKAFPDASPGTLFVFAAGNDGTNNDKDPVSPANIKADNTITVAATLGAEKLATFSNYGLYEVEVAAPGVAIRATIPGDEYLELSGTSMAAPFVTNVAARVQDANTALKPVEIKRILMETVDKKPWLVGKVRTAGIVNAERAVAAANLSKHMSLDGALAQAHKDVADEVHAEMKTVSQSEDATFVLPMPAMFELKQ